MTAHKDDAEIARQLRKLGKPDCTCEMHVRWLGDTPRVDVEYVLGCPIHFPETSELLKDTP